MQQEMRKALKPNMEENDPDALSKKSTLDASGDVKKPAVSLYQALIFFSQFYSFWSIRFCSTSGIPTTHISSLKLKTSEYHSFLW